MTIIELIALLDRKNSDLSHVTKETLFSIVTQNYNDEGKTCQKASDDSEETVTPGAYLVWTFNASLIDIADEECMSKEKAVIVGNRIKRFVELLERLEISTRYDCFDSYGSQSEYPSDAVISQLCFETDEEFIEKTVMPVAIASELYNEKDFRAEFLYEE